MCPLVDRHSNTQQPISTSSRTMPIAVPVIPFGADPSLLASIIRVLVMSKGNVEVSAMHAAAALRQYVVPKDRPDLSGPPMHTAIQRVEQVHPQALQHIREHCSRAVASAGSAQVAFRVAGAVPARRPRASRAARARD